MNRFERERGQAAVETAIVMPLMVFLVLAIIQFNLMWQAKLLTKYAAFQAVRAGSLHNGKRWPMQKAALAVVLPTIGDRTGLGAVQPTSDAGAFTTKYLGVAATPVLNNMLPGVPIIDLKICSPTSGSIRAADKLGADEIDIDDPIASSLGGTGSGSQTDVHNFRRGRLSIQVVYNYRMPIPFANQVIHRIWMGQELTSTLRLKPDSPLPAIPNSNLTQFPIIAGAAMAGTYIIPIRSEYSMRMQSNLFTEDSDVNLPANATDECITYRNNG